MADEFKYKHRAGTAAQWADPQDGPLLRGEIGVLLDDAGTPLGAKIGDGETTFASLPSLGDNATTPVGPQATLNVFATPLATNGTWAYLVNGAYPLNGIQYNTSGAQGDWIEFGIDLSAGTYTVDIAGEIGPDQGIATLTLDGAALTTIDFYGADTTVGRKTATGAIVATTGHFTLRLAALTKNASSSGYATRYSFVTFTRTA